MANSESHRCVSQNREITHLTVVCLSATPRKLTDHIWIEIGCVVVYEDDLFESVLVREHAHLLHDACAQRVQQAVQVL